MSTEGTKFKIFDQVRIITTRRVNYLSAPPGSNVSPKGIWQVSCAIQSDLLLIKGNAIIRIPASDVLKIADYDVNVVTSKFGRLSEHVQVRKEEATDSNELG